MIEVKNLCVSYKNLNVFKNLNLHIEDGKITVILGESGCGKTTLLNALSNLIKYHGEITGMPQKKAVVFQENRLIDCLTVKQNLTLVNDSEDRLLEDLSIFGLEQKADEYPSRLSGGMLRRVAILRALRFDAPVILMDEPFINLDLKLKFNLMDRIKEYHQQKGATIIMVTHDIKEAVKIADRIIVFVKNQDDCEIVKDIKRVNKATERQLFTLLSGQEQQ